MSSHRIPAIALVAATILPGAWRLSPPRSEACALLSDSDVSMALEVATQPGKRVVPSSSTGCIWSTDAEHAASGRRVTLSIISTATFDNGKTRTSPAFTVVPVAGVGEDAYYEVFKADSPFLVVKKGGVAFTVRVLNGLKLKAFTLDQEKSKEMTLAKAVVGRI